LQSHDLDDATAFAATRELLSGDTSATHIAAFLVALRAKGESAVELAAMLRAVRNASRRVELSAGLSSTAMDIVGTGGDKSNSVNISTMTSIVVSACGVPVCKHGNRASSSQCGTADVLEELGVTIELTPEGVAQCLERAGVAFCLAPAFHPAFRHVGPTRRELGVPTVFNLLGPLANPAPITRMLVGVADVKMMEVMASALASRGVTDAWLVHGDGGLDELSLSGVNRIVALHENSVTTLTIDAVDVGLNRASVEDLRGGDAAFNAGVVRALLSGEHGAVRDVVLLNAAAALMVAGKSSDVVTGVQLARDAIDSGRASQVLETFVKESAAAAANVTR
jgi:anthranilate phosphoribosyltransferase